MPPVFFSSPEGSISKQILSIKGHSSKALFAIRDALGSWLDKNCFPRFHLDTDSFGPNLSGYGKPSPPAAL